MSNPRAVKPALVPRRKPPQSNPWPIIVAVAVFLVIAGIAASFNYFSGRAEPEPKNKAATASPETAEAASKQVAETENKKPAEQPSPVIDDDGKTLWISPTDGKPLDLSYLSPGAQIIIALRPAKLLKSDDGVKIRAALGPVGDRAMEHIELITGVPLAEMDRLVVGCQTAADSNWLATLVVHAAAPVSAKSVLAKQSGAVEKEYGGAKYWATPDRSYFFPGGDNKVVAVGPDDAIHDVIDLAGQMPPLRRDIERLMDHTDNDRQLTIVLAPNSLFGEGQTIFSGPMSRLRSPLFWFLGDELSGAALSLNWDANFFLELIATPTLETSTETAARIFNERVAQIPQKLEEYVVNLNAQPYGRMVIARFPEMLRKLALYTRSGFDKECAMLRCYLPAAAGHNLIMAGELTLAETPGAAPTSAHVDAPVKQVAASAKGGVKEQLAKVTSLKFARDTLESALDQLSQDIGAPIVIRGPDLQADGITKNQSFGIDLANKPAEEILVEILRLANPDKTSPGPHDVRQKLVYIIEQKPDKSEQIVVTTRAKAKERNDELPTAFRTEK